MRRFDGKMRVLSLHIPETWIDLLDSLVEAGYYRSRAEAIRIAIRDFIRDEIRRLEAESDKLWGRKYADF